MQHSIIGTFLSIIGSALLIVQLSRLLISLRTNYLTSVTSRYKDWFSFLGLKLVSVVIMIRIPSVFIYMHTTITSCCTIITECAVLVILSRCLDS